LNKIRKKHCLLYFCVALGMSAVSSTSIANDCKPVNREQSIQKILSENNGSKVLKVVEKYDDRGCPQLVIRILVDGTVKAIKVSG